MICFLMQKPCSHYKYGPFSFDLQSHLAAMRADNLITVRPLGYGATFETGEDFSMLEERLPRTISKYRNEVSSIVSRLGGVGVKELEPLATALFFTRENPGSVQPDTSRVWQRGFD